MKYKLIRIEVVEFEDNKTMEIATLRPEVADDLEMFIPPLVLELTDIPADAKLNQIFEFSLQEPDEWILT